MKIVYNCEKCGRFFNHPKRTRKEPDTWGRKAGKQWLVCPHCGNAEFEDWLKCEICGCLRKDDGGEVCPHCVDDLTGGFARYIKLHYFPEDRKEIAKMIPAVMRNIDSFLYNARFERW